MIDTSWKSILKAFDERRNIAVPGDTQATIKYCVQHFLELAQEAIQDHGYFAVALSGGSTPKAIYEQLKAPENRNKVDWSAFLLFWSDERAVPPDHPESNYRMAMEAAFNELPIPKENIFRMKAEENIEKNAKAYEALILEKIPLKTFDLVMLGVGEDGHTASLFPHTHGLHVEERLVIANFIPAKETWRMTLTFKCINSAFHTCIYALGKGKADIVAKVLNGPFDPDEYPSQRIGTQARKSLWILDKVASLVDINALIP